MSNATTMPDVWIGARRTIEVPCTVEVEQTADTLFAHVALEGFDVDEGDVVTVHDAPTHIGFGERVVTKSRATIHRANPLQRLWTRLTAYLELTELYEVGFQPKE